MTDVATLRARNAEFWTQAAAGWIRQADRHDQLGGPLGAAALTALAPVAGESIVDIGCATGGTTAQLAAAIGTGAAVGVDLSADLIAAARQRHPGLRFEVVDVETVPVLPGAPYDAAYSRMVLMLLADPVAGLTTIRRSLRPGGRLAATVFRTAPFLAAALLGAAPHIAPVAPLPIGDEPGPFAFADPDRVRVRLAAAGFADPVVEPVDEIMAAPDDPSAVAEWLIELGPAGAPYRAAPPPGQAAARSGAAALLERYRTPGIGYRLPVGIHVITARA
jgi:SAM-dependent methyltransferase